MSILTYKIRTTETMPKKPQQNTVKHTLKKHWKMPLQNLNKNYGNIPKESHDKTHKEYAEGMQNTTKQ